MGLQRPRNGQNPLRAKFKMEDDRNLENAKTSLTQPRISGSWRNLVCRCVTAHCGRVCNQNRNRN